MAGAAGSSSGTETNSKKNIPEMFSDLLDLAMFSFSCQSGLKSNHKIRGDPVLEGVAAFLGRLISCSNPETQAALKKMSPERLGNWQPGNQPTKEVRTLISSRLKTAKSRRVISERKPVVLSLVAEKVEFFCEEEDREGKILREVFALLSTLRVLSRKKRVFSEVWKLQHRVSYYLFKWYLR